MRSVGAQQEEEDEDEDEEEEDEDEDEDKDEDEDEEDEDDELELELELELLDIVTRLLDRPPARALVSRLAPRASRLAPPFLASFAEPPAQWPRIRRAPAPSARCSASLALALAARCGSRRGAARIGP